MSDTVLLTGFSNMELEDFHYHIGWKSDIDNFVEIVASAGEKRRHLRFVGVSKLKIDEGFDGVLSGMEVVDISGRQWDAARIEVRNFEQDAGITFLAVSMEVISDT